LLVAGAAAGGALAGCHPTRTPIFDPLYTGLLAGVATVAASRAARGTLLLLAVVAVVFSRGAVVVPATAALLLAFAGTFTRRANPVLGALVGAFAIQSILRWPALGFQGLTALLAALAITPVLASGASHLPRRGRRWLAGLGFGLVGLAVLLSIPAGIAALRARSEVNRGIDAAQSALASVSDGNASAGTGQLRVANAAFAQASKSTGAWWTLGARLVPIAAQQRQALAQAVSVAQDVTAVSAREAGSIDFGKLQYQSGGIDLRRVAALSGPLDIVDSNLASAVSRLAGVRSSWLVGPLQTRLRSLDSEITRAHNSAALATQAVQAAPSLLGAEGVRHYFVAFMSPAESRGLDGLIASYAELTANRGRITLTTSADISALNSALGSHGGGHINEPADYLARYGGYHPQQFFQDLTYSPDMPSVSTVVAQLYAQAGGDHLDGVLAVDPEALASLLSLSGPVHVPGFGQLGASNAANVLLKGQYAQYPDPSQQDVRRTFQQEAIRQAFERLSTGSLPSPRSLSSALDPAVRQGRLLLWSFQPADQPLLRRLGLAGAFPARSGGDLLSVVTQNAATNKIDAYLQRSITYQVAYDPGNGGVTSTVTIGLHNEAPATGLSSQVIGSYGGSGLPSGTNQTWLTVYSPLGLTEASEDGQPVRMGAVPELGVMTYSTFVKVSPGGSVTLVLRLSGRINSGKHYQITLHQQPMVLPDRYLVQVSGTRGWSRRNPAWKPGPSAVSRGTFSFRQR
jgi:hypothetical protein